VTHSLDFPFSFFGCLQLPVATALWFVEGEEESGFSISFLVPWFFGFGFSFLGFFLHS
jgi:hypothetical protein